MTSMLSNAPMNQWQLEFNAAQPAEQPSAQRSDAPPVALGVQLIGLGTAGCKVTLQTVRESVRHGERLAAQYFEYPSPALPTIEAITAKGEMIPIEAKPFCPVGDLGERRDQARQHPLLERRYRLLLRGTSVYEDRRLALSGEGGGAIGGVVALDVDRNPERFCAFIADNLRWMLGVPAQDQGSTDLEEITQADIQRRQTINRPWVLVFVFGATGATGNALSQLLPYLFRLALKDMGLTNVQLWGVAMGPLAFKGLTPFVMANYRALMFSLDHMARHGQHREYINGLRVDMDLPPFDQLFLVDDPRLKTDDKGRVTEAAQEEFFARTARALRLLLTTNAWDVVSARAINVNGPQLDDKLRWMTALNAATAGVNRSALYQQAIAARQAHLLDGLARRLSARPMTNDE